MKSMRKNLQNKSYRIKKEIKNLNRKVEISLIYMNPTQKHRISLTQNSLAKKLKTKENFNN